MTTFPYLYNSEDYRVSAASPLNLSSFPTELPDMGYDKLEGQALMEKLRRHMAVIQGDLYAEAKRSIVCIFQGMDASGKDSTIRRVYKGFDPAACHVQAFKAPTVEEYAHDFLWRVHPHAPRDGEIAVWNRSHYEDIVIAKINQLATEEKLAHRMRHIEGFEDLLSTEGTVVLKFFMHISKPYQKIRLQRRLDNRHKRWKFELSDITERARWNDYERVYQEVINQSSFVDKPWYVIPSERRWARDLLVGQIISQALEKLDPQTPEPKIPFDQYVNIPD